MEKKAKNNLAIIFIFALLVLDISFISSESYIDPDIEKSFENQISIRIIVELKDDSGIIIDGTKEEKIELMNQKDKWFELKIEEVLSSLPKESFELIRKSSNGFSGLVNKVGFENLVNNDLVDSIYLDVEVHATKNKTTNNNESQEPNDKIEQKFNLIWFWIAGGIILITLIILYLIKKKK